MAAVGVLIAEESALVSCGKKKAPIQLTPLLLVDISKRHVSQIPKLTMI